MTQQIPDAPWIRDAELNGVPFDDEPVYCPLCGAEDPEKLYKIDGEIIGCSECVEECDPYGT